MNKHKKNKKPANLSSLQNKDKSEYTLKGHKSNKGTKSKIFKRTVDNKNKVTNSINNNNNELQKKNVIQNQSHLKNDNKIQNKISDSKFQNDSVSKKNVYNIIIDNKKIVMQKKVNEIKIVKRDYLELISEIKSKNENKMGNKIGKFFSNFSFCDISERKSRPKKCEDVTIIYDSKKELIKDDEIIDNNKEKFTGLKEIENNNNQIIENNNEIKDKYYNKKEGLYNFGSTCYMNSFLQILMHVPGFIEELKEYEKIILGTNFLFKYLIKVADNPTKDNLYDLRRLFIKYSSNYKYYGQEDSQEFGAELLQNLNNELSELEYFSGGWNLDGFNEINKFGKAKEKLDKLESLLNSEDSNFKLKTIINHYFYFYENELIICDNKVLNINFYGDADNQISFNKNSHEDDVIKLNDMLNQKFLLGKHKLIKLPIILNFTLLRAIIEEPLIKTKVTFDDEIDVRNYLDKDFGNYSLSTQYVIYALNICIGRYKKYGHYYSYILINKEWYKFDDYFVKKVDKNSILNDLSYIYGIYYINKEYLQSIIINNLF